KLHEMCDELHVECLPDEVVKHTDVSRFKDSEELGFLEQNLFRQKRVVYTGNVEDISIYEAGNPKEELKYVIGEIIRLTRFEGYRYGDIAVVTGDIENYGNIAANMFIQNDIPAFIDQKRKVTSNPLVEMIRSALEIMEKGYSYDSVFRYLRTGMTDIEREDIDMLDNYCTAVGIRSRKQWQEQWTRKFRSRGYVTDLEKLNQLRSRVLRPLQILEEGLRKKGADVKEYTCALYYFIVEMNSAKRINELGALEDTGNEYQQIYEKTMELLDKIAALLGDEVVSVGEYARIIDSGFDEIKVGLVPPASDCVLFGDIQRTRLDNVKVMFFIGVNDGIVPKQNENRSVLSDIDRENLEQMEVKLSPSSTEKAFMQRFYLYLIMTKPSRKLYITYARKSSDGKSVLPSYLIRNIKRMYPKLEISDESAAAAQLSYIRIPKSDIKWDNENLLRTISEGVALSLYGQELTGSITAFESFAACQFSYFLKYGLEIDEREEYRFAVKDFGTILHEVVEQVSRYVKDNHKSLVTLPEAERKKLVERSIGEITRDYGNTILMDSSRNEYLIKRMTQLADRTLWAIGKQLECGVFVPDQFESKFIVDAAELPNGQKLSMQGKIDRIDICEDEENVYVKVIDYKSGQSDFNLLSTYYGLKIQLIMYMKAAVELEKKSHNGKKVIPAGILYYNMKDPVIELGDGESADEDIVLRHIREELRMKGVINSSKSILKKLDDTDTVSLAFPLAYKKDGEVNVSRSNVMDTEHFGILEDYVIKKSTDTAQEIYNGNVALNPYEDGTGNSCKLCPYKEVCGFSQDLPGHRFRRLEKLKAPDVWERIRGELGKDGESMD
ncbi:MAG: PD-(D/E)XK nuclease family protein, partial [Eubacteriales bacterium]|nr:PD-(D/E)XK nuclease family protein [Eubacteriales bacterium]